jgi:hypothetical protein
MLQDDGDIRVFFHYARLWSFVVISTAVAIGLALISAGPLLRLSSDWTQGCRAVGESIIASLLLYVLVSLFLDPRRQQAHSRELARYAINEANARFQRQFEISLPTAVFESSATPKPAFRDAFVSLLSNSTRYDHIGTTAEFASFRLATCSHHREVQRLDQIRLCLLDTGELPSLHAAAELRLREAGGTVDGASIAQEMEHIKECVHISLLALYEARHLVSTTVFMSQRLPFFRCEMFDQGMFLTYYLGDLSYPETLQFSSTTRPYRSYQAAMDLTRRYAHKTARFRSIDPSADLIDDDAKFIGFLRTLGFTSDLNALHEKKEARFASLRSSLNTARIDPAALF